MSRVHVEKRDKSHLGKNWVLRVMGQFDEQPPGDSLPVESSFE